MPRSQNRTKTKILFSLAIAASGLTAFASNVTYFSGYTTPTFVNGNGNAMQAFASSVNPVVTSGVPALNYGNSTGVYNTYFGGVNNASNNYTPVVIDVVTVPTSTSSTSGPVYGGSYGGSSSGTGASSFYSSNSGSYNGIYGLWFGAGSGSSTPSSPSYDVVSLIVTPTINVTSNIIQTSNPTTKLVAPVVGLLDAPEPGTWGLVAGGLGLAFALRRKLSAR